LASKSKIRKVKEYGNVYWDTAPLSFDPITYTLVRGSGFLGAERQSIGQCSSRLRPQVRTSLFRLPRILAHAELLRPKIQRQRVPVDERQGFADLAKSVVLAGDLPHGYFLAPREHR
jgi:hypothetical protein